MATQLLDAVRNTIKHWYIPLIIGILFLIVAGYSFTNPEQSYEGITIAFSVSFIIIGFLEIYFSLANQKTMHNWGWILFLGIVTALVGVLLINHLEKAEIVLPFYFGFMLLFRSVAGISYSLDLKSYGILDWGTLMVFSVLGVIFSFILLWNPEFAQLTIFIWVSLALLMIGVFNIVLAFKLRKIAKYPEKISESIKEEINKIQEKIKSGLDDLSAQESTLKD